MQPRPHFVTRSSSQQSLPGKPDVALHIKQSALHHLCCFRFTEPEPSFVHRVSNLRNGPGTCSRNFQLVHLCILSTELRLEGFKALYTCILVHVLMNRGPDSRSKAATKASPTRLLQAFEKACGKSYMMASTESFCKP